MPGKGGKKKKTKGEKDPKALKVCECLK